MEQPKEQPKEQPEDPVVPETLDQQIEIKVNFPVFVASLFKSGTTTVHAYFQCGKQRSVHYEGEGKRRTGPCIQRNIKKGNPPFRGCGGDYDIFPDNANFMGGNCFDPSVHGLDAIYNAYPNATILLSGKHIPNVLVLVLVCSIVVPMRDSPT